jgi:hypothetical protein
MTAQTGAKATASAVEVAVLLVLCLLAGVGAALAFVSALVGLSVGGIGLIAVTTYALTATIDRRPRNRREESRRLSVTDISTRRRGAPGREDGPSEERSGAPTPQPEPEAAQAPDVAPFIVTTVEPDRVVPFRAPSLRL